MHLTVFDGKGGINLSIFMKKPFSDRNIELIFASTVCYIQGFWLTCLQS